jgi:DNA polymerase-3 subunit delta'
MKLFSQIIITSDFYKTLSIIQENAKIYGYEVIDIIKDGIFLVSDVDLVIEKAYLASEKKEILVLGAKNFSEIVQNRLLKILEEPPKNKEFILLFTNKASILNTIKSRLPIQVLEKTDDSKIEIPDLSNLNLEIIYEFVQKHKKDSQDQMKILIQKIFKEALKSKNFLFKSKDLDLFKDALLALEYGANTGFILIGILLKLLEIKKNKI